MIIAPRSKPGVLPARYPVDNAITRLNPLAYWPMIDKGSKLIDTRGLNHLANIGSIPHPLGRYFDGTDDYLQQQIHDTEQGALSYQGNDTTTAEFRDADQDFSEWESSGEANFMIVVTNDDATVSWGYCEASDQASDINVYTDRALTSRGWNETAPVAGSKTPSSYEIRKSTFQITGALTIGCWVWMDSSLEYGIITSKLDASFGLAYWLDINSGDVRFRVRNASTTYGVESSGTDYRGAWHFVTGVFDPSTYVRLYIDKALTDENTTSIPASINDVYIRFLWGARSLSGVIQLNHKGMIGDGFIFDRVLSGVEIEHIFQDTAWKV